MSTFEIRTQVTEFAATYPTPNVRRAVDAAQAGLITWEQVYNLFAAAMAAARQEVTA